MPATWSGTCFCSQIIDLKTPVVVALTMMDLARNKGTQIDIPGLERELGVPVVAINPRKGKGITAWKKAIQLSGEYRPYPGKGFYWCRFFGCKCYTGSQKFIFLPSVIIQRFITWSTTKTLCFLQTYRETIEQIEIQNQFNPTRTQAEEIMQRYGRIAHYAANGGGSRSFAKSLFTEKLDNILLHRTWGYLIYYLYYSSYSRAYSGSPVTRWMASNGYSVNFQAGFQPHFPPVGSAIFYQWHCCRLSGIIVFIPQIMILFGLITLLEDTGYMAGSVFLQINSCARLDWMEKA